MTQDLIAQARAEIDDLRTRANLLESYIETCEREVASVMGIAPSVDRSSPTVEIIDAAVSILIARKNEAMSVSDFVGPLAERGIVIAGQDPMNNLSAKLSREAAKPTGARLKSNGPRNGYQLSDIECGRACDAGLLEAPF